jgi:hypothetical protein
MDIILLAIFSYAIYRLAVGYNITPWKWIIRYVVTFMASTFALVAVVIGMYGPNIIKDMPALEKISLAVEPFVLLYQFVLFFFFRTRIVRYVHILDQVDDHDNNNNNFPNPPAPNKDNNKEQKDFSYFR